MTQLHALSGHIMRLQLKLLYLTVFHAHQESTVQRLDCPQQKVIVQQAIIARVDHQILNLPQVQHTDHAQQVIIAELEQLHQLLVLLELTLQLFS